MDCHPNYLGKPLTLMHGSICSVNAPPGNPRDKSSPSSLGVENCLKQSCPGDRGWGIKNNFSLILRSMCYFPRGLHEAVGQDYVFSRENAGICRKVVKEPNNNNDNSLLNYQIIYYVTHN